MTESRKMLLSMQMFAEGAAADGGDGAAAGVTEAAAVPQMKTTGRKTNPLADVKYGIQPQDTAEKTAPDAGEQNAAPTEDRESQFKTIRNGEFKDLFDKEVSKTVKNRLAKLQTELQGKEKFEPVLRTIAKKYGVDVNDADALLNALDDDEAFYEQESVETGVPVEMLRKVHKTERENEALRESIQKMQQDERNNQTIAGWISQAEQLRGTPDNPGVYPQFDFDAEMENPQFRKLIQAGVDVKGAYEAVHINEILPTAMQFAAKQSEQKIANAVRANGARPTENGLSGRASGAVKTDLSSLTKKDLAEINRRVARGEKISFG